MYMVQEIFAVVDKMNIAIFPLQPFPNTCICILIYIFQVLLLLWNPKHLVIFYYNFSLVFFPFPSYESWDSFFKDFTAGRGIVFFLSGYIHSWLLVFYAHCLDHQRRTVSNTHTLLPSKWPSDELLFNCLSWLGMITRGLLHIVMH